MSNEDVEITGAARNLVMESRRQFEKSDSWVIERGLSRPPDILFREGTEQYLDVLPLLDGKNFLEYIALFGREQLRTVRWIDIGCGAGLALLDARKHFKGKLVNLKITGLGHNQDTNTYLRDIPRGVSRGPTKEDLEKENIKFVHGNFIDSGKLFGGEKFDVITSCFCLYAIDYPHWSLIKKVWRLLENGGVAFIAPFSFPRLVDKKTGGISSLSDYLRENYQLKIGENRGGVSFEKTRPSLPPEIKNLTLSGNEDSVYLSR